MKIIDSFAVSVIAAFIITVILGHFFIPAMRKKKIGQHEREEGLASHKKKEGTPTMGGVFFIPVIAVVSLFFAGKNQNMIIVILFLVGFSLVGFLDDWLKTVKHQSEGLTVMQKLFCQIIVMAALLCYMTFVAKIGTEIRIPFINGKYEVHGWYYVIVAIMILGTVNGANFTDGLDGLGASVGVVISIFFTVASVLYKTGIEPFTGAVIGALLAFLMYNINPARVFMGDTGSLGLGGIAAGASLVTQNPLIIIIVACIYLAEVLSVMIQVLYYKKTKNAEVKREIADGTIKGTLEEIRKVPGKRFFRMSPIHHHFEKDKQGNPPKESVIKIGRGAWEEAEVTSKFTVMAVIFCVIGIIAL